VIARKGKTVSRTVATNRARFQKEMEQRLRCWGARRTQLAAMLEEADVGGKEGLFKELTKLKTLEAEGLRCLSFAEDAGAAAWARLQADLIERWERVNRSAEATWARAK
jgi:hypothetical protein